MQRLAPYIFIVLGCILATPAFASAATLTVAPVTTNVTVGDIVTVRLLVNSEGKALNLVDGTLTFPSDMLSAISLDTSQSILALWIQQPSFSNVEGTITFNGGVPSPGFTGSSGTVLAVTFEAKKAGKATLILNDAEVLANNGLGTDILGATNDATLTIDHAPPVATSPPAETPPVTVSSVVANIASTTSNALLSAESNAQMMIYGILATSTDVVRIRLEQPGNASSTNYTIQPDSRGHFTFGGPLMTEGVYQISVTPPGEEPLYGGCSQATTTPAEPKTVSVRLDYVTLLSLGVILLVFIMAAQLIMTLWSVRHLRRVRKNLEEHPRRD